MSWTDERVTMLRDLWAKGLSASQIAVQLGGVTRNAVIGKAHRLGLESRPSPIRNNGTGSRRRNRAAQPAGDAPQADQGGIPAPRARSGTRG